MGAGKLGPGPAWTSPAQPCPFLTCNKVWRSKVCRQNLNLPLKVTYFP